MTSLDLNAINVPNMLGVMLLAILLSGNVWRLRERTPENVSLVTLMFLSFTNCIMDPLVYYVEGRLGIFYRTFLYFGNTWIFIVQLTVAICWVSFFCRHLNGKLSRRQHVFLGSVHLFAVFLLIVNFFTPIIFEVDDQNVYHRGPLFFIFVVLNYLMLLDSILIYILSKMRGGSLKFFPVWVYVVPITVGGVIQSMYYGISLTSVCMAISVAGLLASLQNEMIYRDALTGLYNRTYLDYLLKLYSKKGATSVTGIMLDLNAFKSINDQYGHAVGDEALINASRIFRKVVDDLGLVIRYAGDEFIILINSQDDRIIAGCMSEIRRSLQEFNCTSGVPYKLASSMGSCKMDFRRYSIDEFVNEIDKRMYEDKKIFYERNASFDRRH